MRLLLALILSCFGGELFGGSPTRHTVGVRENVERYLQFAGLSEKVKIFSVGPDRVYARDLTEHGIVEILSLDPNWCRDAFRPSRTHKGAIDSWRYMASPSLQVTVIRLEDGTRVLDVDIDRFFPLWSHLFREGVPHWIGRHIFHRWFKFTNQHQVQRKLDEWFGVMAVRPETAQTN